MPEFLKSQLSALINVEPEMHFISRNIAQNFIPKLNKASPLAAFNFSTKAIKDGGIVANQCEGKIKSPENVKKSSASITNPQNLPHFPVPPLQETIEKFIRTTEVHLTTSELKETKSIVKDFENGVGRQLQSILEKQSKKEENWLASRWLKTAYLTYRDPVCVFSSPGMTFPPQQFSSEEEFLKYTSEVIYGALKYKDLIDKKQIPVEKMGKNELDMSQYDKVFGTCRIPGIKEDSLEYHPESKHIALAYKNHFYKVPVYSRDGSMILPPNVIYDQLRKAVQDNNSKTKDAVGILSSDNRDAWGQAYQELINDTKNKKSVEAIQKSLFVVCLDQEVPVKHGVNEMGVVSEQLIHGGGAGQNAGNRWFDKTIQMVVNRNGVNGFCYEHSPAEGQPIAIMTDFIVKSLKDTKQQISDSSLQYEPTSSLPFNISPKLSEYIRKSSENVDKLATDLHVDVLHFKEYGKEFIKTQKLSPDSYLQMAMQYAFYKLHHVPAAHYESAHLRMYINGRTETIRSCSNESIAWAKSMVENRSDEERVKLLRAAVNGHRDYTLMALQGKGVDRHLLGLKLMALENNIPVPELYKTPGFIKSAHFRLSTSQVASKYISFMCYGPLVANGYGCCYNPRANDMIFAISSWRSNNETDTNKFMRSMQEALQSMNELLCRAGEKPKSKL